MATSPEKVAAAIDHAAAFIDAHLPHLQQHASGLQAIALGAVAPFLPQVVPQLVARVREQLPDEPEALDAILTTAAEHMLSLRSDPPAIDADASPVAAVSSGTDDDDQAGDVVTIPHRIGCSCDAPACPRTAADEPGEAA